jgi:hypothetical protein
MRKFPGQVTIKIDANQYRLLCQIKEETGVPLAEQVRRALAAHLEKVNRETAKSQQ